MLKEKKKIPEIFFYALAKPRVEKGAQYIDTIQPGWEDSIDEGLDMFIKNTKRGR